MSTEYQKYLRGAALAVTKATKSPHEQRRFKGHCERFVVGFEAWWLAGKAAAAQAAGGEHAAAAARLLARWEAVAGAAKPKGPEIHTPDNYYLLKYALRDAGCCALLRDPLELLIPAEWDADIWPDEETEICEAASTRDEDSARNCFLLAVIHAQMSKGPPLIAFDSPAAGLAAQLAWDVYGSMDGLHKVYHLESKIRAVIDGALVSLDGLAEDDGVAGKEEAEATPSERDADAPNAERKEPLTQKGRLIYAKLRSLEEHEAMTLPEIQDWLDTDHDINLDEGTWKTIRKELKPYGVDNRAKVGYFIRK